MDIFARNCVEMFLGRVGLLFLAQSFQAQKQIAIKSTDFTICVCTESSSAHFIRLPNNLNEKCDTVLVWNRTSSAAI